MGTPGVSRFRRLRRPRAVEVSVVAVITYSIVMAVEIVSPGSDQSKLVPLGITLLVFDAYAFWHLGGRYLTASSTVSYAIAIFGAFPAIVVGAGASAGSVVPTLGALITAVSLSFVFQVAVVMLCGTRRNERAQQPMSPLRGELGIRWIILAVISFASAVIAAVVGSTIVSSSLGMLAILLAALATFLSQNRAGSLAGGFLLIALSIGYMQFVFEGFGRLVLGVLGVGTAMIASIPGSRRFVKLGLAIITVPAIIYLSLQRLQFLQQLRGTAADPDEGIGSVIGPFNSSAVIIDAVNHGEIPLAWGNSILVALLAFVPRSVWPSKPDGFGTEIVPVTQPPLAGARGYSDAALLTGEFTWNFGPVLGALALVVIALVIRWLDTSMIKAVESLSAPAGISRLLLVVTASSSLLHLFWGGFFTFTSRTYLALAILGATAILLAARGRKRPRRGLPSS